ncbi:MAG: DUF2283 domain-containing protein [Patescibacteria group bacterium]
MITYQYDKEADIFYFSQGKPSASDETVEAGNDVLIRISPRSKRVRGFTLLNASHRVRTSRGMTLPFSLSAVSVA